MNIFTFTKLGRVMLLSAVIVAAMVGTAAAQTGTFKDSRDGQTYKTVVIGGKKWMAQNLNYKTDNSWCYEDKESNCKKYGRLYDWNTAKTACPSGWHLPSREEWGQLAKASGGAVDFGGGRIAGKKLKSTYGWNENGNGTDEFGFSALPSGYRIPGGSFYDAGAYGYWWTATEYGDGYAYFRRMGYDNGTVEEGNGAFGKGGGFSLRCVSD